MNPTEIRARFQDLTVWTRGDQRAPHKPLLLLYALGRYACDEDRLIPWSEIEPDMKDLLAEFGPPSHAYHPEYPFGRLRNDGIWEVHGAMLREGGDLRVTELRENEAAGGLLEDIYQEVTDDPELLRELVHLLLESHFTPTYYQDICSAVGLGELVPMDFLKPRQIERDPRFRDRVLTAYERRCSVCGFEVRLGQVLVGIEAAHIKWHQARGPSVVQNGLALCSLHHKLFDRGAFSLSDSLRVTVSEHAHGSGMKEWLFRFHDSPISDPVNPDYRPEDRYLEWHWEEVFRTPARVSA